MRLLYPSRDQNGRPLQHSSLAIPSEKVQGRKDQRGALMKICGLFCPFRDQCTLNIQKGPFVKPTRQCIFQFIPPSPFLFSVFLSFLFWDTSKLQVQATTQSCSCPGLYGTHSSLCGWPATLETFNGLSSTGTS